ncbi:nucleotidyltransferase family protein [Candidatus Woesearchaeota archaeon]|nr:nucleotidyltransferase family protein [Candidatus Woesearchaeota archaeon]
MQQKKQAIANLPKKAIILAGGLGTRLRPLTLTVPKPLIPINESKVLVDLVIDILKKNNVKEVYLSISYLKNKFEDYFKHKKELGVKIHYLHEETPMGTAGPLLILKKENRQKELNETFIMVNGDNLFNLDFKKMYELHKKNKAIATIGLTKVEDPSKYGVVRLDENFKHENNGVNNSNSKNSVKILEFVEKPAKENAPSNLISSGYYILEPEVFDYLPDKDFVMMEKDIWPALAKAGKLFGFISDGQWFDTGTMEAYEKVKKEWKGI